jgi:hypothetical protein
MQKPPKCDASIVDGAESNPFRRLPTYTENESAEYHKASSRDQWGHLCYLGGIDLIRPNLKARQLRLPIDQFTASYPSSCECKRLVAGQIGRQRLAICRRDRLRSMHENRSGCPGPVSARAAQAGVRGTGGDHRIGPARQDVARQSLSSYITTYLRPELPAAESRQTG